MLERLSPHLTLAEFTGTQHREYLAEQAAPPAEVLVRARRFAFDLFEPARALVGPLRVSSGYRCPDLNRAVGGSATSVHTLGLAADVLPVEASLLDAYRVLAEAALPIDQLIWEFGRWLHIGAARPGTEPRHQHLMIFRPGEYLAWNPEDPRLGGGKLA